MNDIITSDSGDSECNIDRKHFERGDKVVCIDRSSKFCLQVGIVEDNDLMHVRVDFNGTKIWLDKKVVIND